jgi:hypothetical protein
MGFSFWQSWNGSQEAGEEAGSLVNFRKATMIVSQHYQSLPPTSSVIRNAKLWRKIS